MISTDLCQRDGLKLRLGHRHLPGEGRGGGLRLVAPHVEVVVVGEPVVEAVADTGGLGGGDELLDNGKVRRDVIPEEEGESQLN